MSTNIDELSVAVSSDVSSATSEIDGLTASLKALKDALQPAADAMQKFRNAMSKSGVEASLGKTRKAMDKTLGSFGKLTSTTLKNAASVVKFAASGIGKSVDWVREQFSLSNTAVGKFLSSLMRIAKTRFLRAVIRGTISGAKEGLENLAHASTAVNQNLSKLTSVMATFKNAAGSAIYAAIEPWIGALESIGNAAVTAFNYISMFFSILAGKNSYKKALNYSVKFADATKSAGKSAKGAKEEVQKYKQELMSFDEINSLHPVDDDDSSSGGGGGGGSSKKTPNYSAMFTNAPIDPWLENMVDTANFSSLGQKIAQKINSALASINWESIRTKALNVSSSLTTLINGFAMDIDSTLIGNSIANAINIGAESIRNFWRDTSWSLLGWQVKQAVLTAIEGIDPVVLADAITGKLTAAVTFIRSLLPASPREWDMIIQKIVDFLQRAIDNFPEEDIGYIIGNLIVGGIRFLKIAVDNGLLESMAHKIVDVFKDAAEKITAEDVQSVLTSVLGHLWEAVKILFKPTIELNGEPNISAAGVVLTAGTLWMGIKSAFGILKGAAFSTVGKNLLITGGIYFAVQAALKAVSVIDKLENGQMPTAEEVGGVVKSALISAGLFLTASGNWYAGLPLVGFGIAIEPAIEHFKSLVTHLKEVTALTEQDVFTLLATGAGLVGMAAAGLIGGIFWFTAVLGIEWYIKKFVHAANSDATTMVFGDDWAKQFNYVMDSIETYEGLAKAFRDITGASLDTVEVEYLLINAFKGSNDELVIGKSTLEDYKKAFSGVMGDYAQFKLDGESFIDFAEHMGWTMESSMETVSASTNVAMDKWSSGIGQTVDNLVTTARQAKDTAGSIKILNQGFYDLTGIKVSDNAFRTFLATVGGFDAATRDVNKFTSAYKTMFEGYVAQIGTEGAKGIKEFFMDAATNANTTAGAIQGVTAAAKGTVEAATELSNLTSSAKSATSESKQTTANAKAAIEASGANASTGASKFGTIEDAAEDTGTAIKAVGQQAEVLSQKIVEIPRVAIVNISMPSYNNILSNISTIRSRLNGLSSTYANIYIEAGLSSSSKTFLRKLAAIDSRVSTTVNNLIRYSAFASGGYPKSGQLYIANENGIGSELIGQIGNRHAVANQDQIGDAIFKYMDAHSSNDGDGMTADELAGAIVRGARAAGIGAVYLDGHMLSESINRESQRIGRPAINT